MTELSQFWGAIVIMALFVLAMFALVLRVGPRSGFFNQPAEKFRPPGRIMQVSMYIFAALHVAVAVVAAIAIPSVGGSVILVGIGMAAFYVLAGLSHRVAQGVINHRLE